MATVGATSQAASVVNFASGSFTGDATVTTVTLGFKPRYMKIVNSTDTIVWEKLEGMAAANSLKTINHDTAQHSIDTGSAITFNEKDASLSAALAASGKAISWVAWG